MDYTDRILRGAAYLDEHHPGWIERTHPDELDLFDTKNCILGQATDAGFYRIVDSVGDEWAEARGFMLSLEDEGADPASDYFDAWDALTEDWRLYIAERRARGTAATGGGS